MEFQKPIFAVVALLTVLSLFAQSVFAQATTAEVDSQLDKDLFLQSIFASSYITLSPASMVNGHVWSGAATTVGAGATIDGSIASLAATTLAADVLANGNVTSGAATTVGAGAIIDGRVESLAATTLGAGAVVNYNTLLPDPSTPEIQDLIDAQSFFESLPGDIYLPGSIVANVTYEPGTYNITGPLTVASGITITLDASGNEPDSAVFIFNISGHLAFGAGVNVEVLNGNAETRVIWNVTGTYISIGANSNIEGYLLANTYVTIGADSKVGSGVYSATSYVFTGADSEIDEPFLGDVGGNTPPVAFNGPEGFVPTDPIDQPSEEPQEEGSFFLFADDADGDALSFRVIPGSLGALGNHVSNFEFDEETGAWSVFCLGMTGGHDSFKWVANDGQTDSNVATQYFLCAI